MAGAKDEEKDGGMMRDEEALAKWLQDRAQVAEAIVKARRKALAKCATCRTPLYTYAIECNQCERMVYPTAAERPRHYTCRLCLATPAATRARRVQSAALGKKSRLRTPSEPRGASK